MFFTCAALLFLAGCGNGNVSDGYGNFESTEVTVSAETAGRLLHFDVLEGVMLPKGVVAAQIDTTQQALSRRQLEGERAALMAGLPGLSAETEVYRQQRRNVMRDVRRYQNLVREGAVPPKQLEEFENQVRVIDRQVASLSTRHPEIRDRLRAMDARIAQLDDMISKCRVLNPVSGTVLTTYVESGEVVSFGMPLYKIADLDSMFLRVYLSETQLSRVRIGQHVEVLVDSEKPADRSLKGRIAWISSKAEFTPKIIQTREDRVSMVYAVKVQVRNPNGLLKIGMPGEMRLRKRGD